ncbi:MAG: type IV toxin-antitoxin system AbiEi family antitoxin domain-containing protein [Ignavibacteriales bacterium]|nr:type IV toxin-antitoxin system AbiEi family antitoxin domain-containing protein [Ignavibacteriales bacterium]
MENFIEIFKQNGGYSRMLELKNAKIHTRTVSKAVKDGLIEKVKSGLYKLIDYPWDEHGSFADVCNSNKRAVICLLSAASYYELTTFNPAEIYVAVPHNTDKFDLKYPPIRLYYFSDSYYEHGIETIETKSGMIKIYNKEKTIVDIFRYINKLGEDVAVESLKEYLKKRKVMNIPKLLEYSEICGVKKKMEPMIKALLS